MFSKSSPQLRLVYWQKTFPNCSRYFYGKTFPNCLIVYCICRKAFSDCSRYIFKKHSPTALSIFAEKHSPTVPKLVLMFLLLFYLPRLIGKLNWYFNFLLVSKYFSCDWKYFSLALWGEILGPPVGLRNTTSW
jgi:hypothetical protein